MKVTLNGQEIIAPSTMTYAEIVEAAGTGHSATIVYVVRLKDGVRPTPNAKTIIQGSVTPGETLHTMDGMNITAVYVG